MEALRQEQLLHLTKKQRGMIGAQRAHEAMQAQLRARGVSDSVAVGESQRPPQKKFGTGDSCSATSQMKYCYFGVLGPLSCNKSNEISVFQQAK